MMLARQASRPPTSAAAMTMLRATARAKALRSLTTTTTSTSSASWGPSRCGRVVIVSSSSLRRPIGSDTIPAALVKTGMNKRPATLPMTCGGYCKLHVIATVPPRTSSRWVGMHPSGATGPPRFFSSCYASAPADDDYRPDDDDVNDKGPIGLMVNKYKSIRIRYASQGGTAQLFAMQLADAIQERDPNLDVTYSAWNEESVKDMSSSRFLSDHDVLNVYLCSTTGIGDPPENGREFYQWLMRSSDVQELPATEGGGDVAVFGLGNQVAHPSHYNVIGKNTYDKLVNAYKCHPIVPLGLGDDGDCIEDDFDQWQDLLLTTLFSPPMSESQPAAATKETPAHPVSSIPAPAASRQPTSALRDVRIMECPGSVSGTRRVSAKYPMLDLEPSESSIVRVHLRDDPTTSSLYPDDAKLWSIAENRNLNPDPVANGLHELVVALPTPNDDDDKDHRKRSTTPLYEAGDHLVVYPRNPDCVVEAYLQLLDDVSPHSIIRGIRTAGDKDATGSTASYPYPFGLTVYETLSHCVDLSAVPSPSLARFLLNRKDIDYKNDISKPRRTVLTLLKEQEDCTISLEDLLFALAPIQGRYYSISSSPLKHPNHVRLLYRPVRYVSGRGYLREGLCSTYMSQLNERSSVVARVNSNPSFRLPTDPQTPVVILAGGCGVAPFRAFLEQRQALMEAGQHMGECYLFVGFRNPADAVWSDLMKEGLRTGALTQSHVAYATGVPNASPLLTAVFRESSERVWNLITQQNGHLYICGGAQSFGAAVKRELIDMAIAHGGHDAGTATSYLQELAQAGRLCEDLAD